MAHGTIDPRYPEVVTSTPINRVVSGDTSHYQHLVTYHMVVDVPRCCDLGRVPFLSTLGNRVLLLTATMGTL